MCAKHDRFSNISQEPRAFDMSLFSYGVKISEDCLTLSEKSVAKINEATNFYLYNLSIPCCVDAFSAPHVKEVPGNCMNQNFRR